MAIPFRASVTRGGSTAGRSLYDQARRGLNGVMANLNRWVKWVDEDVLPEVMLDAVSPTMDISDHYAPKDTHTMVNSRYAEVRGKGGNKHVEVGYNRNGEAPYTIFVHEMPQFFHAPPTQYKFLERAMNEDTPEILGRIASGMKARTGL